jgi:hypothetical protein
LLRIRSSASSQSDESGTMVARGGKEHDGTIG